MTDDRIEEIVARAKVTVAEDGDWQFHFHTEHHGDVLVGLRKGKTVGADSDEALYGWFDVYGAACEAEAARIRAAMETLPRDEWRWDGASNMPSLSHTSGTYIVITSPLGIIGVDPSVTAEQRAAAELLYRHPGLMQTLYAGGGE